MLLEHPPTYTLGRRAVQNDLVYGESNEARGIALYGVDRGGRATYTAPASWSVTRSWSLGERYDVVAYLRKLEDVLIRTAGEFGVTATGTPSTPACGSGRTRSAPSG